MASYVQAPQNPWETQQPAGQGSAYAPRSPHEEMRNRQNQIAQGGLGPNGMAPGQVGKLFNPQGVGAFEQNQQYNLSQLAMQGLLTRGFEMQGEEQKGLDWAKQQMTGMWPELMKNPLTEADINSLGAGQLEEIARGKMRDMQSLREHLGVTGINGQMAGDLGIQAELSALGQITTARRGLRERVASTTAQHQMNMLNALGVGRDVMSAVSSYGADALAIAAGQYQTMYGYERGAKAAQDAADSSKESAIFGGLLGAAGGVFGGLF